MARKKRTLIRVGEGVYQYAPQPEVLRFMAKVKHQGRYYRKFGFPTISKAKQWRQSRKGAIADGRLFPEQEQKRTHAEATPPVPIVRDYAQTWMEANKAKGLKHTTLIRYQGILATHILPAFGFLPLNEVIRVKVKGLVATMGRDDLKPKTIKNVVLGLSAMYTDAIEDGHVQHNPALKPSKLIQTPKRGEQVQVFMHEEEYRILQTAQEHCPHYYSFILCLFRTGMRVGEAVALRPEDLDLHRPYVWVRRNFTAGELSNTPKSRQRRTVDLSSDLVTVLKEYLVVREAEAMLNGQSSKGWLFTTPHGEIIRSNNFRDRIWKPLLKATGVPYRWVHATATPTRIPVRKRHNINE